VGGILLYLFMELKYNLAIYIFSYKYKSKRDLTKSDWSARSCHRIGIHNIKNRPTNKLMVCYAYKNELILILFFYYLKSNYFCCYTCTLASVLFYKTFFLLYYWLLMRVLLMLASSW
jgi:hypothetical protein